MTSQLQKENNLLSQKTEKIRKKKCTSFSTLSLKPESQRSILCPACQFKLKISSLIIKEVYSYGVRYKGNLLGPYWIYKRVLYV